MEKVMENNIATEEPGGIRINRGIAWDDTGAWGM